MLSPELHNAIEQAKRLSASDRARLLSWLHTPPSPKDPACPTGPRWTDLRGVLPVHDAEDAQVRISRSRLEADRQRARNTGHGE